VIDANNVNFLYQTNYDIPQAPFGGLPASGQARFVQQQPIISPQTDLFNKMKLDVENSKLSKTELEKKFRKFIISSLLNGLQIFLTFSQLLLAIYNIIEKKLKGQPCNDRIAHPSNPNKFIVCLGDGDYSIMDCPDSLVYNKFLDRCDYSLEPPPLDAPLTPCGKLKLNLVFKSW
jgi:hypothetical protein